MPAPIAQSSTSSYLEAVKKRRSVYGVTDNITVTDDRIVEIVNSVIQTCPSAWNMQSTRMLVTLGKEHKHFWDTVITSAKPFVLENQGEDAWKRNEDRFKSFRKAYGTISLFEDHESIEELSSKFSKIPLSVLEGYAEHSDAMHQITLWTALELEGLGASLQHSQNVPGVEDGIKSAFKIPASWSIKAEIVFGGLPDEMPSAPDKESVLKTVKVCR